jgi:hypothetical protein
MRGNWTSTIVEHSLLREEANVTDPTTYPCSRSQSDVRRSLSDFEGMPNCRLTGFCPDTLHVASLLPNAHAWLEVVVRAVHRPTQRPLALARLELCGNVIVVRPFDGADGTLVYDRFYHRHQRVFGGVLLRHQALMLADEATGVEVALRRCKPTD